jgi:hypothetical protein
MITEGFVVQRLVVRYAVHVERSAGDPIPVQLAHDVFFAVHDDAGMIDLSSDHTAWPA